MGGYKIINFGDVNLITTNTEGVTISGVYTAIEHNYRKPLLLHGIVIDGVEKADVYAPTTFADNEYSFSVYGHTITVTNLDVVKITV